MLVSRVGVTISNPPSPDTLLMDASQLLYHIVWPSSGTVGDLADGMRSRLIKYNGVETYVIFDRYDDISAKDHERQRRAGEGSAQYQLVECACSGVVDLVYLLGLLSQNCILFKPPSLSRCCEAKYF